jgi:hypothetical protein
MMSRSWKGDDSVNSSDESEKPGAEVGVGRVGAGIKRRVGDGFCLP